MTDPEAVQPNADLGRREPNRPGAKSDLLRTSNIAVNAQCMSPNTSSFWTHILVYLGHILALLESNSMEKIKFKIPKFKGIMRPYKSLICGLLDN